MIVLHCTPNLTDLQAFGFLKKDDHSCAMHMTARLAEGLPLNSARQEEKATHAGLF